MRKNLTTTIIAIMLCVVGTMTTFAQVSFGKPEKFNDDWNFYLGDNPTEQTRWRTLDLPHDWSVEGQMSPALAACQGFLPGGIGWYKKTFTPSINDKDKKVYIYFEGVYNRSEVYLNGTLLGKRPNGYVSFMYELTPNLKFGEENTITVKADHSRYADSRWYTGSGIYRNVWLVTANPVHIAQWGVYAYPSVSTTSKGELIVATTVQNEGTTAAKLTIQQELMDNTGKIVATAKTSAQLPAAASGISVEANASQTLKVSKPHIWTLDEPYLYTLKTTILNGKEVIDETTTKTGFRTLTFDANKGFALNGEWMKVKGVCIHHDAGVLGAVVPREVWERRLLTLKSLGVNAVRMSHNAHNPEVYALCDELGILVKDEFYDEWEKSKRKWIEGWNQGTPGYDGSFDFFPEWKEIDLADLVRRNRNHISIMAWSIGNEIDYPNDPYTHPILNGDGAFTQPSYGGYQPNQPNANRLGEIAKELAAVVKKYDKSRPVTAGLAGVVMSNQTEYPAALDIVGYNYTESQYDADHAKYPNRVIFGSETRHDLAAWKSVRDKEFIFGQFLWTGIDYLGESGRFPARGSSAGLIDVAGFIKPRGKFRASLWDEGYTTYLGTYPNQQANAAGRRSGQGGGNNNAARRGPILSSEASSSWNYTDGQSIRVVCYTNAPTSTLYLNDKEVGTRQYNDTTGIVYWDVPYAAGTLTVKGFDGTKEVCTYTVKTTKAPAAISLKAYKDIISKDKGMAQIELQVVDEDGKPVFLADNAITCMVRGGRLIGMENADMSDTSNHRGFAPVRVKNGRLIAYIEAQEAGTITATFTSPWLKPATITITAQ